MKPGNRTDAALNISFPSYCGCKRAYERVRKFVAVAQQSSVYAAYGDISAPVSAKKYHSGQSDKYSVNPV